MPARTQRQQTPEMFHNISPQALVAGAAAAAGAVLAGRWLYNNSDKVTMFIGDMADQINEGWTPDQGLNVDRRPPIVGSVDGKQTVSKRNIPVH